MKRPRLIAPPSHRDIIKRNGGPAKVGRTINIEPNTAKAWSRLDSIPAPHWKALADAGLTSLDELAQAAASKSGRQQVPA